MGPSSKERHRKKKTKKKGGIWEKIPVQLWRWGLRMMQSREARVLHCFEETVGSGGEEDEVQTVIR